MKRINLFVVIAVKEKSNAQFMIFRAKLRENKTKCTFALGQIWSTWSTSVKPLYTIH
jgi:hypothetical protein